MPEVTVTDQNFEQEVIKSSMPVLVDFWAVWCFSPRTFVYQDSNNALPAHQVTAGQSLLGWKEGMANGIVSYSKTTKDSGHCRKISTVAGRSIKLTDDHLLFTQRGWVKAIDVKNGDQVAVFPAREPVFFKGNRKLIIDTKEIIKTATPKMKLSRYIKDLEKKGLIPLTDNNSHLLTLTRLIGALFSDGSLYQGRNNYREISFVLGRKEDADNIMSDLRSLGFDKFHFIERYNKGKIGERIVRQHSYRVKCLSTSLYLLFLALGVLEGKKITALTKIPLWIKKGHKAIKREFLAALLGGDGPKIAIRVAERVRKSPYNHLTINDYEFHKSINLLDNGLKFASDLKELFEEFGVKVRKIFSEKETYLRKDGIKTVSIHIVFSNDFATGYSMAQKIGYYYCKTKAEAAYYTGEFLRTILNKRHIWQDRYVKAVSLSRRNFPVKKIAEKLDLTYDTVFGWIKLAKKATVAYHKLKFTKWLKEATKGLKDGFLWQEISSVTPIFLPSVQRISVSTTHNFIANGFLVHNCGPCQMQNPILEEIAREYESKAKIAKLNVDENPATVAKYSVMSIPTLMLFSGGNVVKQMTGVQGKETLVTEINKVIKPSS